MTMELNRTEKSIDADKAFPATNSKSVTSNHSHIFTNSTRMYFDPMVRSVPKRRYSERSSSSTTVTGEDKSATTCSSSDSEVSMKSSHKTQGDYEIRSKIIPKDEIRSKIIPRDEIKLFANLPDPTNKMCPDTFLHKLVYATCDIELEPKKARSLENFFEKVTDDQVVAYTMTVVSACRNNDLDALKKLHSDEGQTMNCCNRFGESLLTMACRRGFESIVEYLLQLSDVDIRICDDSGRTVMHDACWNPSPQLKICEWIMERDPALFFIADNRGCTPFQYARPEHWGIWRQFLLDNKDSLQALKSEDVKAKLSKEKP